MKTKKNYILSLILLSTFFGCANQLTQATSDLNLNKPVSGIVKEFTGNKINTHDESLLIGDPNFGAIAVNNNMIYYSTSQNIARYNVSDSSLISKLPSCYIDIMPTVGWGSFFKRSDYIPLCDYRSGKVKQGNDGNTYVFNNSNISRLSASESVKNVRNNVYDGKDTIIDIAIDKNSNIYYASKNEIRKYTPHTNTETVLYSDNNKKNEISNLEIDNQGNIYIFDKSDLKVKKLIGNSMIDIIGGGDFDKLDIPGKDYIIRDLNSTISIDNDDNLYLIEKEKQRILKYNVSNQLLTFFIGNPSDSKTNLISGSTPFKSISDLTFDKDNTAYIIDFGNGSIKTVDKNNTIKTLISNSGNHGDGTSLNNIYFKDIVSLYSKNNNLYISESDRIRRIDENYNVTTISGNGEVQASSSPDFNTPVKNAESMVSKPKIRFIDSKNNLYFDENYVMKKLTTENKIVTFGKNIGSLGVTEDSIGNMYFSSGHIKKMNNNNQTEIYAGKLTSTQEFAENNDFNSIPPIPDINTRINEKRIELQDGMDANNIYNLGTESIVSDSGNNIFAVVVQHFDTLNAVPKRSIIKIFPDRKIKVITKDVTHPQNLIIDNEDNVYYIDNLPNYGGSTINKINKNGYITRIAGNSGLFMNKDVANKRAIDIYFREETSITNIAIDNKGFIYFSTNQGKLYRIE